MIKPILSLLTAIGILLVFTGFYPGDEDYLAFAAEMPAPIGGLPGLHKNIEYPEAARQLKTEGKVFLMAYINEQGSVDDVKILKGINQILDQAAN